MCLNALPGLLLSALTLHNTSLVPLLYSTPCPPSQMWCLSSLDIWALLVPKGHFPHSTLHCSRLSVHHLLPQPTIKTFFMLSSQLYIFFFLPCCMASGISVLLPRITPMPLHWKHGVLTTGLPGESLLHFLWNLIWVKYHQEIKKVMWWKFT